MNRRTFLLGASAIAVAPAIVLASDDEVERYTQRTYVDFGRLPANDEPWPEPPQLVLPRGIMATGRYIIVRHDGVFERTFVYGNGHVFQHSCIKIGDRL